MRLASAFIISCMLSVGISYRSLASDHDDGENDAKARSLNLTDLYVFKENSEAEGGSANHLVFIMNTNPRSLPQQQYYFSTQARYDFRIARVGSNKTTAAGTNADIIMRFQFGSPTSDHIQPITFTFIRDGEETSISETDDGKPILTTSLSAGRTPTVSTVGVDNQSIQIFAGLREDPFFFDVTAFFIFRATGRGYPAARPVDFTEDYNVNSIAVRIPILLLQRSGETVFDTWTTIAVPQ